MTPACFYNAQERQFQVIAVDVLASITKMTGLRFAPVNGADDMWVDLLAMLADGRAAMVPELLRSPERDPYCIWPQVPYATDFYVLLSRSDTPDVDISQALHASIGLIAGSG